MDNHGSSMHSLASAAPNVDITGIASNGSGALMIATKEEKNKYGAIGRKEIWSNPSADILFGPVAGRLKSSFKSRDEELVSQKIH